MKFQGNRLFIRLVVLSVITSSIGWSWKNLFTDRTGKAMELYEKGAVDEALDLYSEEAIENPDAPDVLYNLGNMLYRNGRFEEAIPSYTKAEKANDLKQMARFNSGNSLFRLGATSGEQEKLKMALEAYREAIQLDPNDLDAKYNYEFVQRMLSEAQDQQQQSSQPNSSASDENQQKQDQKQEQKQEQKQNQNSSESPDENKSSQKDEENSKKDENPRNSQDQQQADKGKKQQEEMTDKGSGQKSESKGEIKEEDARRMLEALMGNEKDQLAERFRMMGEKPIDVEKDW